MAHIDHASGELVARIVYFGPPRSGKATNLERVRQHPSVRHRRTLSGGGTAGHAPLFDGLLPDLGLLDGRPLRIQFGRVDGPLHADPARRLALRGADVVVFVADCQAELLAANLECLESLQLALRAEAPVVLQYNKLDLPNAAPLAELASRLNAAQWPALQAIAARGIGVDETLSIATRLCFRALEVAIRSAASANPDGARIATQRWTAGQLAEAEESTRPLRLSTDQSLAFRSVLDAAAKSAAEGPNRHATLPAMLLPPSVAGVVAKAPPRVPLPPKKE